MKIGVLGAGSIGGTLGRLWRQAGHEVRFGTRHPEQIAQFASDMGASVELALELGAALTGKIVLDANNAYPQRDGNVALAASADAGGSSAWLAARLPGSRVVKAFNTVYFKVLQEKAHSSQLGIPLAGDDRAAMSVAEALVRDAGFVPVVVGGLATGKQFVPGTTVYNTGMDAGPLAHALGGRTSSS